MKYDEFLKCNDEQIEELANEVADQIVIRTYDEHGSHDNERKSTSMEHNILYRIAYASMCNIRRSAMNLAKVHGVLDMMETMVHMELPEANAYMTMYIPVKRLTGLWDIE